MIDESEKRRIMHAMMRAFNTFSHQYYQNIFAQILEKDGRADPAFIKAAVEDAFLTLRAADPYSYMAIHNGRVKNRPVMKHRKVLVESAIRSIAKGDFAPSEIGRVRDGYKSATYTARQRRRLVHERYGPTFLKSDMDHRRGDKRTAHMSTVFSKDNPQPSPSGDMARAYLNAAGMATRSPPNTHMRRRVFFHSVIRLAFPRFLDDMLKFRGECRAVLESLGERNDRTEYLWDALVDGADLLVVFYSHVSSILDWVWFKTKSEEEQLLLLRPAPKMKYKKQDAQTARKMLVDVYGRKRACNMLDYCGKAFLYFEMPRAAAWAFTECARIATGDAEQGVMWQNAAAAYRAGQNYKLALGAIKKALKRIRAAGDPYVICNALQLTGEFQWRLGFKKAARGSFEAVEKQGAELDKGKRWRVPFILAMSFRRLGRMSLYRRYITKALTMVPDDDPDRVLFVARFAKNEYHAYTDGELPVTLWEHVDDVMDENDAIMLGVGDSVS